MYLKNTPCICSSFIADAHNWLSKHMYKHMYNLSLGLLQCLSAEVMGQPLDPIEWSLAAIRSDCKITVCLKLCLKSLYAHRRTFGSDGLSSDMYHRFPGWFASNVSCPAFFPQFYHQQQSQTKKTNKPKKNKLKTTISHINENVIPIFCDRDLNSVGNA